MVSFGIPNLEIIVGGSRKYANKSKSKFDHRTKKVCRKDARVTGNITDIVVFSHIGFA